MVARRRRRSVIVWLVALVAATAGVLVASVVWLVGVGQYLEDYCFTRVGTTLDDSWHGPFVQGPATIRCEYGRSPDIVVTDWLPLLWTIGCVGLTGLGLFLVFCLARRLVAAPAG